MKEKYFSSSIKYSVGICTWRNRDIFVSEMVLEKAITIWLLIPRNDPPRKSTNRNKNSVYFILFYIFRCVIIKNKLWYISE